MKTLPRYACESLFLMLVLISGCACHRSEKKYPVSPPDARPETYVLEARPFEIGSVTYNADFGSVAVPENRGKPTSRLIHIPFLRIHSRSDHPAEPIFAFAGGPGQTNISWDWGKAETFLPEHDFVVVGYRGVDGSSVLNCPEVEDVLTTCGDPLSEASMRMMGHAWSASAKRFQTDGVDIGGYTMLECIEDNELVRRALGYERIDLLSESYGTRIAFLYGLRHPEQIFRSAMISVNPPGGFDWDPQVIDRQLRYYGTLWSKDSLVAQRCPDLYAAIRSVLNAMPRRWLLFRIDPGKVRMVTFAMLFSRKTAAMVFDAFVAATQGDPSGLALMSLAYDYTIPSSMIWGDAASKAVSADYDSTRDYCTEPEPSVMPLGSPMSKMLWGPLSYARWPVGQLPEELRRPQRSAVQTLLLSGSVDFSTPPELSTKRLLPYLSNGRQVMLSEFGHVQDIWYLNPENTRRILTSFYDAGVPDTEMNSYIPMDFSVGWGFPTIAKVVVGGLVVLIIALAAALIWAVRRYRRRRVLQLKGVAPGA